MILRLFTYMLIPKVVNNSASSNIQPPIFWYVVCIHETQLLARWTPKSELSVIGSFLWPKSATKMILITLLTKSTPPNEIICINDHSEVWIYDFCRRTPATSHSVIGLLAVNIFCRCVCILGTVFDEILTSIYLEIAYIFGLQTL